MSGNILGCAAGEELLSQALSLVYFFAASVKSVLQVKKNWSELRHQGNCLQCIGHLEALGSGDHVESFLFRGREPPLELTCCLIARTWSEPSGSSDIIKIAFPRSIP